MPQWSRTLVPGKATIATTAHPCLLPPSDASCGQRPELHSFKFLNSQNLVSDAVLPVGYERSCTQRRSPSVLYFSRVNLSDDGEPPLPTPYFSTRTFKQRCSVQNSSYLLQNSHANHLPYSHYRHQNSRGGFSPPWVRSEVG